MLDQGYFKKTEKGDRVFCVEAPKIKFGTGVLKEVGLDAEVLGMTRVGVYTDILVAEEEPLEIAVQSIKKAGLYCEVFKEVEVEPTDLSFKAASRFASEGRFDGFVPIGGGSVIDTCKASNPYSTFPTEFLDYVNAPIGRAKSVPGPLKPHIACPTTFGTASECTGIAIFDLIEMQAETGIVSPRIRPDLGILDPRSLHTLHPMVRAANAFDVFSHACESLTTRPYTERETPDHPTLRPITQGANPYSDITSLEAIRLIGSNLIQGVHLPQEEHLEALMFAGMLAGIGFGNAGCHLPHGMSYAVAGLCKDYQPEGWSLDHPLVPHGISVIINSPAVFRFTGHACNERHLRAAEAMGADVRGALKEDGGELLADQLIRQMKETGIPNGLEGVGYSFEDLDALTDRAYA